MTAVDPDTVEEVADYDAETRAMLDELGGIAEYLDDLDDRYERRAEIFLALRARTPPVKHRIIAEFAHSTEAAVIQVLRKAKAK